MSSSASSNKRSTWKRYPSVTSLCNQFAEMSISALSNKRSTSRPDPSVTSLCNQFAEISSSASSNKRSMWKRKRIEYTNEMTEKQMIKKQMIKQQMIEQGMIMSSSSSSVTPGASTSTSSIQKRCKYDVFLSFRGEDIRKKFVDHLYHALKDKGIYTYKDDEKIQKGKRISDDLFQSIEDSKFYIIFFSKNYASSSWCLDELAKIMECHKMNGHTAYPVFYDVEPTEVRKQSGAIGEAFAEHENQEAAEKWKGALKEAADLAGWELKNTLDGHEAKFIKKIVQEISLELRSINFGFDEKLVGIETRVKDVVSSLEPGTDEVRMIGIKGMGGAGKTTTARAVFDHLSADFEATSFVENVREVSNGSVSGLKKLQEQVLSDVLNEKVTVSRVFDGKNMMKRRMCGIKVLLVLDDVDHIQQLKALAGELKCFKPGSRILITTRDEQVLVSHRVNFIGYIDLLSNKEAICLFSRYAFGTENPVQGYEELSGKVVRYAAGLPLTLKVLGSFLCGKDKLEWIDAIDRLKRIPLKDTLEKLELSYTSLEDDYKEIFLDVVCMLKGRRKTDAITILESCGFQARNGLKVLEQRSLITVDEDGFLGMHDHIEEMGKNIVRRSHLDEPNKHSRLWINEEIEDILAKDEGTEATRCLKVMVSTSTSSIQKRFKYDVFISFRGEDTRKTFVDHLYHALKDKGVYTYKDDEKIQKGKRISDDLFQSIEDSKFYIIVFSKNYASSSWCLEELVKIMECHKMHGHTAYPVFYDVEPTEVRNQSGAVGDAFSKHENQEAAGKWKGALKEAAGLAGLELKNTLDGHEAKFIKKIVHEISLELRSIDFGFDEKLVGMKTRVKVVVSSLEDGINEVRMIGIKGMGGAGKTTLARAVFDHLSNDFEAKSFVGNVREVSNGSISGLKNLQEQVLSNVLNEQVPLNSVDDGKNMMKKRMCGKKVLLVLDDVDHIKQLEALAGERKWFKPGSRILITTRDEQVLIAHGVNVVQDIVLLSGQEAISLFSRYAFGRENPLQGYKELSQKVVHYAAGLPLTIKVLGSFLCSKDKDEWVDAIERLKKIPLEETLKQLELSYISLEDDYKEIFLDIACILKGKSKEDAIRILECCGFYAKIGLKVLEQRSLITVNGYGRLGMHDHIEEMGKNIVRRSHPKEPNKHSHLWIQEEIEDILANDMGTEATRSLKLDMSRGNSRIVMKGLGKMKKLRYLEVDYSWGYLKCGSDEECLATQYFPNSLEYLNFGRYPFLYLPRTFQANNLVGLWMSGTKLVQLWEEGEKKVLKKLKFLFLYSYLTTFDFGMTPNLETLSLHNYKLKELRIAVSCQKLMHLNISLSKLITFDLGLTPNLETLYLSACADFEELCMPVRGCQKLNYLEISRSKLRTFDLGLTPNLETLSLFDCADFEELHVSAACPNLKFLDLRSSRLRSLDLELIPNLESLDLNSCSHFKELHVSAACPNLKFLNLSDTSLKSLDLELIPNLESLDLRRCYELVEINAPVGCLKKVGYLNLSGCELLEKLPEDIGRSECLKELDITYTGISHLPQSIFGLKGLHIAASQELLQLHKPSTL